jgi:formylglycine-generating enzyme required for sulfatase activity
MADRLAGVLWEAKMKRSWLWGVSVMGMALTLIGAGVWRGQAAQDEKPEALASAMARARRKAGETIRDCFKCPEMVVVPAGSFLMGSPSDEPGRLDTEGPQHKVTIAKPFAVGKYAVTFAQWDACVADGGCGGYQPPDDAGGLALDDGWGRDDRPVNFVSWGHAQGYVKWLSQKTGKSYRLPSEAEREYFTRAGTTTPFWWGSSITPDQANYYADAAPNKGGGKRGVIPQGTVPVKSFKPNMWGLYQVHGNVQEWTEDCWNGNYDNAPADGSARTTGNCSVRVIRGGSWFDHPRNLRAASRLKGSTVSLTPYGGGRVVRTLNPAS